MTKKYLYLNFSDRALPTLWSTEISLPSLGISRKNVRGKWRGAYHGHGSFEWSKAVQGFCLLLLHAKLRAINPSAWQAPDLMGLAASHASSLDYAIDKQPSWMAEMLGTDSQGHTLLRRAIDRTNPNRKRPGPVALTLNARIISGAEVIVTIDREVIESEKDLLDMIKNIESGGEMRMAA